MAVRHAGVAILQEGLYWVKDSVRVSGERDSDPVSREFPVRVLVAPFLRTAVELVPDCSSFDPVSGSYDEIKDERVSVACCREIGFQGEHLRFLLLLKRCDELKIWAEIRFLLCYSFRCCCCCCCI